LLETEIPFKVNSIRVPNFPELFGPLCSFPRVYKTVIDQKACTERGIVDSVWYELGKWGPLMPQVAGLNTTGLLDNLFV